MLNLIEEINVDLIRCKKVIDENNYLEIVIAIEELQDKYRDKIKSLDEKSKDIVWNYSMKDLVNIKDSLIEYREEIIEKEKLKNFHEKMLNFKVYIEKNEIENRTVLDKIINIIEDTIGFLIFISSFLRPAFNISINLYLDTIVVLNIINTPNIIAK